ncbi:hypothetical protein NC653_040775 [Populus alba x Populus x berolinensis]|uniref:Uncharacterized protein n=1 Tax=Populus alba x Populus x berolinensis TaxID=444605 RepID=A0AAD6L771_9ROSI|nr:hypothetical protein NC653_040775 [Populus alba x Populus x berolinensis]
MENPSSLLEAVTVTGQLRFFYQLCFLFGARSSLDFVKIYEILCSILNGFDGPFSMPLWKTAARYGATKFDRLKDGATMLALTSNYSLRIPSSLVKIFDTDAGGSKPIAITFSSRIHGRDLCCEWQVNH